MAKILLVEAVNKDQPMDFIHKHLGLGYLASNLHPGGDQVRIIKDTGKLTVDFHPDIVGIASVTQNFHIAQEIAHNAKKRFGAKVVVGGHHITALPHTLTRDMDYAVLGEGEATFAELIEAIKAGKPASNIRGLAFYNKGRLVKTESRGFIKDLDTIKPPARELLNIKEGSNQNMFTSRGCPYKCPYCSSAHFWDTVRFHSPKYVVSELRSVMERYKPKSLGFADDLFIADRKRLAEIAELMKKEGLAGATEYGTNVRCNLVNSDTVRLMKDIGITYVAAGFESGSPDILKMLKKGTVTVEQNQKAIDLMQAAGIKVTGTFMIGSPGETKQDMQMTYDFIKRNNLSEGSTFVILPYPGTELWGAALKRGIVSEDMDWNRFNIDFEKNPKHAIFISDKLSRKELYKEYMRFKELWFSKTFGGRSASDMLKRVTPRNLLELARHPRKAAYAAKNFCKIVARKL